MSTSDTKQYLSRKLQLLRDDNAYTQLYVAKRAGLSVNHYARIERGEFMPKYETIEKLAKAYGVKPGDLLPSWK